MSTISRFGSFLAPAFFYLSAFLSASLFAPSRASFRAFPTVSVIEKLPTFYSRLGTRISVSFDRPFKYLATLLSANFIQKRNKQKKSEIVVTNSIHLSVRGAKFYRNERRYEGGINKRTFHRINER